MRANTNKRRTSAIHMRTNTILVQAFPRWFGRCRFPFIHQKSTINQESNTMTKTLPLTRWVFLLTGMHALVCVPAIILAERLGWSQRAFGSLSRLYSVPMKNLSSVLFVASLLALTSCAHVTSKQVIGDTPAKLDPKKWNGAWAVADGESIHVRVKSADLGLLEVARLEVGEEAIELKRLDVRITEAGGWLWASYKEEKDKAFAIKNSAIQQFSG